MESIDRLREYVYDMTNIGSMTKANMSIYIDAIEQEVEREVDDNERFRREAEPFHDRLCRASERREDVTLWGVDYIPLPVDADGEPILVGDVMEWDNGTFTVHELKVTEDGWTTWDEQHGYTVHVDVCHHHTPTVEDVLMDLLADWAEQDERDGDMSDLVAEYAAKLTLRGDE